MKRPFEVVFSESAELGYVPGDQVAHRAAAALADRCDAPTLARFADIITLLETIGGQLHITALRREDENGRYETIGFGFQYESVDARIREAKSPSVVQVGPVTIPISDMQGPAPEIELPEPSADSPEEPEATKPEPEPGLRDEIEREVEALEEPVPAGAK